MSGVPIEELVQLLLTQNGGRYRYGGKASSYIASPKNSGYPIDCSGLISWGTGRLGEPLLGSSGEQFAQCASYGLEISVDEAIHTRGALLFIQPDIHVACSLGDPDGVLSDAYTIEAHDTAQGIGIYSAVNRFNYAAKIPGFDYTAPEDDMTAVFVTSGPASPWFVTDGLHKRPLAPGEDVELVNLGIVSSANKVVKVITAAQLARIPPA
jgi:hypothetical protein